MNFKKPDWYTLSICTFALLIVFFIWKIGIYNLNQEFEFQNSISESEIEFEQKIPVSECTIEFENENPILESESVIALSDYDRWYVECIVAGEAGGETLEGQMAVAQCIMNAMIKDDLSPKEVRRVYKYSGWDENFESKYPEAYKQIRHAVWCVFDDGQVVTQEYILWFHNDKVNPKFHKTQRFVEQIGHHLFYAPVEENANVEN